METLKKAEQNKTLKMNYYLKLHPMKISLKQNMEGCIERTYHMFGKIDP